MRTPARAAWPAAALVLAALATGCSAGSSDASPSAVASAVTSATAGATPTTTPGSDVQRLTLTVKGDSVTGDTGTVDVRIGRPVELTVTSAAVR